uniref:ATP synthase peripheral stalk subunit F6, mitochondrial n=1 Tax=Piliocolobus tephrosceles TaxID=591936 RepID=A0A8C9GFV7_9PRIM
NKELDPIQKLFIDEIREYNAKQQASGGPAATGPEHQQELESELLTLKADRNMLPSFKFEDPKFETIEKPQA